VCWDIVRSRDIDRAGGAVERLALVGRLKNDSLERARELIRAGPAFEAKEQCFRRLFVLLPATEVIFVFEGHQGEWPVFGLQDTPWDWAVAERREEWRELFEGPIRIAREAYSWDEESDRGVIGPALAPENF
jgi:hypothetical protein